MREKGAIGEAIVAAAVRHYFGRYDGTGHFDFQYPYKAGWVLMQF